MCIFKQVYRASMVAMMAGADFIKTSTGKEAVNATLPVGLVMCRAIRKYYQMTGIRVRVPNQTMDLDNIPFLVFIYL